MLKPCQVLRYMTFVRMQKTCLRSVLGSLGNRSMSHGHLELLWEEDWMATIWYVHLKRLRCCGSLFCSILLIWNLPTVESNH